MAGSIQPVWFPLTKRKTSMKNGIFLAVCTVLVGLVTSVTFAQGPNNNNGQPLGLAQNNPQQQPPQQQFAQQQPLGIMPAPFQITAAEAQYIDKILAYWEFRSKKVHHYEANFQRWEYDSVFGPPNPQIYKTYSEGIIKYEQPDKGLFQVNLTKHYVPPTDSQPAEYKPRPSEVNEHWVCDGESIFEFDVPAKQLKVWPLPPEQKGQAITNGPLPFLFGANKEDIKSRFYLRVAPDQGSAKDEYWLEAWPKRPADAAEYRFISILIDQKEFLPFAIEVYDRNFNPQPNKADEKPNFSRTVYKFTDRKTYEEGGLTAKLQQMFKRSFYQPQLPSSDWQRVVQQAPGNAGPGGNVPANAVRPQQQIPR